MLFALRPQTDGVPQHGHVLTHAYAAAGSMVRHGVSPTPPCFAVWYSYHSGDNAMVRRVLDTYLSNGRPITDALLLEVHARFLDTLSEGTALNRTTDRLRETTGQVAAMLQESGNHTARYGTALDQFSRDMLAQHPGPLDRRLAAALPRIIADTQEMLERSTRLGKRLEASAQVIVDLQDRLEAALRESRTDLLTGLPNRRGIEATASNLANESQASGRPLALALFDIDHFKAVNDTWGHPVGDAVLRRVANTLQRGLKVEGFCGRLGGEEFSLLLPGLGLATALEVADGLRQAVQSQQLSMRETGLQLAPVTVSAGIAVRGRDEPWAHLLARADAALYRAKQAGRNRVMTEETP
ncbi:MAG: hypothetical protein JWP04_1237 [Belnapia sp.]|nr:hypothetical protein [Belnapia sp.]